MSIEQSIKKWRDLSLTISELDTLVAALIAEHEANKKQKKWEPEGGVFHVGITDITTQPIHCVNVLRGEYKCDFSTGRFYETKAQAEQALIFQRRAMRFSGGVLSETRR